MSEELKKCPFCGSDDLDYSENPNGKIYCRCRKCRCNWSGEIEGSDAWNTRPIEDELRRKLAEAEKETTRLKEKDCECGNPIDHNCCDRCRRQWAS